MEDFKKELKEKAKGKGLDIAENAVKDVIEFAFEAIEMYIEKSPSKTDDLVLPIIKLIKPVVLKLADKIDGKVD